MNAYSLIVSIGLLLGTVVVVPVTRQQKLQRIWDCVWNPKKSRCSSEEISFSRRVVVSMPPQELAQEFLAAEVAVGTKQIKKKKAEEAKRKKKEKR